MSINNKTWEAFARAMVVLSDALDSNMRGLSASSPSFSSDGDKVGNGTSGFIEKGMINPLYYLPSVVRDNIAEEYYEPGYMSLLQSHFLNIIKNNGNGDSLQRIINDIYNYATRIGSHILAHNIILTLSQLPISDLGTWASTLAIAATRSKYVDIQELGVRCFENWEDRSSCEFLKQCRFSERWLQEYAEEVCNDILEEDVSDVLFAQNITREVAE